jgi:hypothetical protein
MSIAIAGFADRWGRSAANGSLGYRPRFLLKPSRSLSGTKIAIGAGERRDLVVSGPAAECQPNGVADVRLAIRVRRCRIFSGTATTTNSSTAMNNHTRIVIPWSHAIQITHGAAIPGVIFVTHHSIEPHPGRSRTSLRTLSSTSVAATFKPRLKITTQLKRSSSVEKPNFNMLTAWEATTQRARSHAR